ncbi:MAG: caspase family protein [Thalassobaculaceae bacterium]|nr:caspase family protein [Thalassobaculaceae bacterium]
MIRLIAVIFVALTAVTAPASALDAGRLGAPVSGAARSTARSPTAPPARTADQVNRDAVAVIIGNRSYSHGLPEVRYAENDARAVRRLLIETLGYRDGNIIDLRNASQAEMLSVFGNAADHRGKLWAWVKPGVSDVFVYYSGHGVPGLRDRRGYLLPVDADPATPEINGVALDLLLANLAKLDARSTVVMVEACFSGNSAAGWLLRSASPVYVLTEAPPRPAGMSVITAAQGDQVASWDDPMRLGLFTRHMLDALLQGAADSGRGGNGDGTVTLGELETYLDDELTYSARRLHRRMQRASVLGDPKSVLVPVIHHPVAPPVAAAAPAWPPPLRTDPMTTSPTRDGKYPPLGPTLADAETFTRLHRDDLQEAIETFYARDGLVWDQRGNPPQVEFAERMAAIDDLQVVQVAGNTFDLAIRYRWIGGGVTDTAAAMMRIAVAPDALSVEKMWR